MKIILVTLFLVASGQAASTANDSEVKYTITGNLGVSGATTPDFLWRNSITINKPVSASGKNCYSISLENQGSLSGCKPDVFAAELKKYLPGSYSFNQLGICTNVVINNCIDSIALMGPKSNILPATFQSNYSEELTPLPLASLNVPTFGSPSIWKIDPSLTESESENLLAISNATFRYETGMGWVIKNIGISLVPYIALPSDNFPSLSTNTISQASGYDKIYISNNHICPSGTIFAENKKCFVRDRFKAGVKPIASLKISKKLPLRFAGRIDEPKIDVKDSDSSRLLKVMGSPVDVQAVQINDVKKANFYRYLNANSFTKGSTQKLLESLRQYLVDSANHSVQQWKFATAESISAPNTASKQVRSKTQGCVQNFENSNLSLASFISSNAMLGQAAGPTFDGKYISYQLGGMHFNQDKSLFLGDYEAQIDSNLARCIYGIAGAANASISIVDSDGEDQKVFTQLFTEQNGLFRIKLSGFHFSDPTIKMRLTSVTK